MSFDIRNHLNKLVSAGNGKVVCPVCGYGSLVVNTQAGSYMCVRDCLLRDIRNEINRL